MSDTNKNKNETQPVDMKKNIGWMVLFVIIAVASIFTVTAQSKNFSFTEFCKYVKNANLMYIALAVVSMLGFVIFEGLAVLTICKSIGYRRGLRSGFIYAASDIYFSAITPSASGGQPVSAWFMMKDGISGAAASVALIANLVFYTFSILLIGLITFICAPRLFLSFSVISKILIVVGCVILALLAAFFILLLFKEKIIYSFAKGIINILAKLKIIKQPESKIEKLQNTMLQYKNCSMMILKNKRAMLIALLFNFLQRASQITVTLFAFLSVGGDIRQAPKVWFVQSYSVLGSNCVPIPGAMGVSDYLLLDGFDSLMMGAGAVNLEILTRALSFYSMTILCGITIFIKYASIKRSKKL